MCARVCQFKQRKMAETSCPILSVSVSVSVSAFLRVSISASASASLSLICSHQPLSSTTTNFSPFDRGTAVSTVVSTPPISISTSGVPARCGSSTALNPAPSTPPSLVPTGRCVGSCAGSCVGALVAPRVWWCCCTSSSNTTGGTGCGGVFVRCTRRRGVLVSGPR